MFDEPPIYALGDEGDDDASDGLSPWAYASRQRWEHARWVESLNDLAEGDRRPKRRAWEAKWARALGLKDGPWDPAEACPFCNEDATPPSGVRPRWTPAAAVKARRPTKPPTLTLVKPTVPPAAP
jgi:hypothetical protein